MTSVKRPKQRLVKRIGKLLAERGGEANTRAAGLLIDTFSGLEILQLRYLRTSAGPSASCSVVHIRNAVSSNGVWRAFTRVDGHVNNLRSFIFDLPIPCLPACYTQDLRILDSISLRKSNPSGMIHN